MDIKMQLYALTVANENTAQRSLNHFRTVLVTRQKNESLISSCVECAT